MVQRDEIKLTHFFVRAFIPHHGYYPLKQVSEHTKVDFTPFLVPLKLVLYPDLPPAPLLQTKSYRNVCSPPAPSPTLLPPINPAITTSWYKFWFLPLSRSVRNIWFQPIYARSFSIKYLPYMFSSC